MRWQSEIAGENNRTGAGICRTVCSFKPESGYTPSVHKRNSVDFTFNDWRAARSSEPSRRGSGHSFAISLHKRIVTILMEFDQLVGNQGRINALMWVLFRMQMRELCLDFLNCDV